MSSLAMSRCNATLSGYGSPPAGDIGRNVQQLAKSAVKDMKAGITARTSWVFNDLYALAEEHGYDARQSSLFSLAQRFLLALPVTVVPPELALDDDGEVSFDWHGPGGKILTATLREDGRLAYACRVSDFDKEHGTKKFVEAIPKRLVELVQQVTDL